MSSLIQQRLTLMLQWRLHFIIFTLKSFLANKGLESAKSLTYTSLFAVVPSITLIVAFLSVVPSFQVFGDEVQTMIFDRLLPSSSEEIESYLTDFASQAKNVTWVGLVMFMLTAYLMLANIERQFNQIWGIKESRKGLSSFLLYWSVLSLGPLLLGIGLGISSYIASLTLFETFSVVSDSVGASPLLLSIFPVFLTTVAFTLLYVAVPNCGVKLSHGLLGGAIVAVSFVLVKKLFAIAIALASYELIYGTFAAVPIFLIWIYVCWVVILLGANIVKSLPRFSLQGTKGDVHPTIIMLALLHKFWSLNQIGESFKINELLQQDWPFKQHSLDTFISILEKEKMIRVCQPQEYLLNKDLYNVSFWNLLVVLPWPLPNSNDLKTELPISLSHHLPGIDELKDKMIEVEKLSKNIFPDSIGGFFKANLKVD